MQIPVDLSLIILLGVSHGVVSISLPGANVFPGNEAYTAGLARLLDEWLAEVSLLRHPIPSSTLSQTAQLVRTFPDRFSFFAVMPLPYTKSA
jgi:hypothetical protein